MYLSTRQVPVPVPSTTRLAWLRMMSRELSAVANCLVFHSCIEVGRSSSSLHATALLIWDYEFVSADVPYPALSNFIPRRWATKFHNEILISSLKLKRIHSFVIHTVSNDVANKQYCNYANELQFRCSRRARVRLHETSARRHSCFMKSYSHIPDIMNFIIT